jgi:hypothetical protein
LQVIFKAGSDALKIVENPLLMDGREVVEGLKLSESQIHQIAHIWLEKTPVASDDEREKIAKKLRIQIASPLDKSGPISTTSQSLAKLINKIGRGLEILDVATGIGTALDKYKREARTLVGQDIEPGVIRLQRLLEYIQFGDVTRELFVENSLTTYRPDWINKFNVVICDAPLNKKSELESIKTDDERWMFSKQAHSETDYWIQTVLSYLGYGRGIVVVPSGWLSRSPEQAMREALVSGGYIEAVIELGGGLSSGTNISVSLLILRKSNPPMKQVRVIDATELGELVRGRRTLSNDDVTQIVAVLNNERESDNSIFVKDIVLEELLENNWVLQPRLYRPARKNDKGSLEILSEIGELAQALEQKFVELTEKIKLEELTKDVDSVLHIKKPEHDSSGLFPIFNWELGPTNSNSEIFYKNRTRRLDWTTDDIAPGDIVVCLAGTQIGNCMYGKEFLESDSSWRRVLVFRIHENFVHSSYVYAWLKFGGFRAQVVRLAGGNLSKTINQKEISRIGIPIPPLETQLLLSSLVARVDALNSTSKEVDNLNDALSAKTQELISSILAVIETDIAESRG